MVGFDGSCFSASEVFHHFIVVLEWLGLEAHFLESFRSIGSDVVNALLKQILIISYRLHIALAPGIELLNNIIRVHGYLLLIKVHCHLICIRLPKASIVVREGSLYFDRTSILGDEFKVNLILFVKIVLVIGFCKVEVPLFLRLLMDELLDVGLFQELLRVSS